MNNNKRFSQPGSALSGFIQYGKPYKNPWIKESKNEDDFDKEDDFDEDQFERFQGLEDADRT